MKKSEEISVNQIMKEIGNVIIQYVPDAETIIMAGKLTHGSMAIYYFFTENRSFWHRLDKKTLLNTWTLPTFGVKILMHEEVVSYQENGYGPSDYTFELIGKSTDANLYFPFSKKDDFYYRFTKHFVETISLKKEKLQHVGLFDPNERMNQLNQLLVKGLISQQEFEIKRKEILDDI